MARCTGGSAAAAWDNAGSYRVGAGQSRLFQVDQAPRGASRSAWKVSYLYTAAPFAITEVRHAARTLS